MKNIPVEYSALLVEIRQLIDRARQRASAAVNAELTLLYWHVGKHLQTEVVAGERAAYGKQIIATLAQQLTIDYGKGWSEKQLRHCLRVADTFGDEAILSTVRRELSWSHLRKLLLESYTLHTVLDLSVENPDSGEEITHRSPEAIMKEIAALDVESAGVLAKIRALL